MVDLLRIAKPSSALFDLTKKFGWDPPLKRIFQTVLSQNCETILIENNHKDKGWTSEHEMFYGNLFKEFSDKTVMVQRELDKSSSLLRDCLAIGKEVFLGITKLRIVFATRKMGWQVYNCHPDDNSSP